MADLLMQHCRQSMCGLNPHALPCMLQHQEDVNETKDSKKITKRQRIPSDQGWKKQRNAKRHNDAKNNNIATKHRKSLSDSEMQTVRTNPFEILGMEGNEDACDNNHNAEEISADGMKEVTN